MSQQKSHTNILFSKFGQEPLIPLGLVLTCAALAQSAYSYKKGNSKSFQFWLRCRVAFQAFTISAMIGGALWSQYRQSTPEYIIAQQNLQKQAEANKSTWRDRIGLLDDKSEQSNSSSKA